MNAPTPPKRAAGLKQLNQPLAPKTTFRIVVGILAVLLLAGGGYWLYQRHDSGTISPAKARSLAWKYLRKQTGQKEFKVALPAVFTNEAAWQAASVIPRVRTNAPPPAVVNKGTNTTVTITSNDTTRVITNVIATAGTNSSGTNRLISRIIRSLTGPGPGPAPRMPPSPQTQLSREFRSQIDQAVDYKTMYRLIGEELWLVEQLLAASDPRKRDAGVALVSDVGRAALNDSGSPWLAARIYQGYVWPQLDLAGTNQVRFDVDALMDLAEDAFREAGETNNLILNYRMLIAKAPQSPRADKMRVRVAALLDDTGELAEALKYLQEIKNPSKRVKQRIESLEARLKPQRKR